jgi:phosphoglucomutase
MQFYDAADRAVGFLWMRGSGTEPVFRAVVDIEGDDPEAEAELLAWHRRMIETADSTR